MRKFTEKERSALVRALRTYIRDMSGKRMEEKRASASLDAALAAGIPLDVLLNPQNFLRLKAVIDEPTVEDYVESLDSRSIAAIPLKEEPDWMSNGFDVVAHLFHDFYCAFDPKGGVWNTPNALENLSRLIARESLGTVLSEDLLDAVSSRGKMTAYTYVTTLLDCIDTLPVNREPTLEEADRQEREDSDSVELPPVDIKSPGHEPLPPDELEAMEAESEVRGAASPVVDRFLRNLTDGRDEENENLHPEDWPEEEDGTRKEDGGDDEMDDEFFDDSFQEYEPGVNYSVRPNPYLVKRDAVESALKELTLAEILGLASTMDDGRFLKLTEITDRLTSGRFDTSLESAEVKQTHMFLSSMLLSRFVDCCRMNGVEMDEEKASGYDILKSEWDLRNPRARTFYKLRELILRQGEGDADLMGAIPELERIFDPDGRN